MFTTKPSHHSRMVLEELLLSVSAVCGETTGAELSFAHSRLLFPLMPGDADGGSLVMSVLKQLFGILPDNPVKPFLEGNTLQIVFMALIVSAALLLAGSGVDHLLQADRLGLLNREILQKK